MKRSELYRSIIKACTGFARSRNISDTAPIPIIDCSHERSDAPAAVESADPLRSRWISNEAYREAVRESEIERMCKEELEHDRPPMKSARSYSPRLVSTSMRGPYPLALA
jgi:hypothetical protein